MKPLIAETSIIINAPIEKVWEVMLDTNAYSRWNPFVIKVKAQGDVKQVGTQMKLFVKWANGKQESSDEVITEVKPPYDDGTGTKRAYWAYRFAGKLTYPGLVRAIRYQWLEQLDNGITFYRTREEFTGLLKNFIPLAKVQEGFERQAKALAAVFKK